MSSRDTDGRDAAARIILIDGVAELLVLLCRNPLSPIEEQRIAASLSAGVDWTDLLRRAGLWDVEAIVLANLRTKFADSAPRDFLAMAAARERDLRTQTLSQALKIVDLAAKLETAGVSCLVLKGLVSGVRAYDDPSLRSFGDGDLLVRAEDAYHARDLLLSLGFVREYPVNRESWLVRGGHALAFRGLGLNVDLHCSLLSHYLHFNLNQDEVWQSSAQIICAGRKVRALGVAEDFLFLCAHGAKHEWMRGKWVVDVANMIPRLGAVDVDRIVELSEKVHSRRILALALGLAADLLGADVSAFPERVRHDHSAVRALINDVRQILGLCDANLDARGRTWFTDRASTRILGFWLRARERPIDRAASVASLMIERAARGMTA